MSGTLTVDPKKYARLANRIVVKALDTEEEYDHMVFAVERLIDKGEDRLSPEESALLETMAILVQAYDDRHHPLPPVAPNKMLAYLMVLWLLVIVLDQANAQLRKRWKVTEGRI